MLADVGQGFLDEPKELVRCERWELVGRVICSQARSNLVSLLKLVDVVLECADHPAFCDVGAQPSNGLPDIPVDVVSNSV